MITSFFLTLAIFLFLDFIWLGVLMPDFYLAELGDLARKSGGKLSPNWAAASIVYLLIALGLVFFVYPIVTTIPHAFLIGALFGMVLYGVYDLTNLATLANYSVKLTLTDVLWGMFACGTTTAAVKAILG